MHKQVKQPSKSSPRKNFFNKKGTHDYNPVPRSSSVYCMIVRTEGTPTWTYTAHVLHFPTFRGYCTRLHYVCVCVTSPITEITCRVRKAVCGHDCCIFVCSQQLTQGTQGAACISHIQCMHPEKPSLVGTYINKVLYSGCLAISIAIHLGERERCFIWLVLQAALICGLSPA